jgi:hypothetical protein
MISLTPGAGKNQTVHMETKDSSSAKYGVPNSNLKCRPPQNDNVGGFVILREL